MARSPGFAGQPANLGGELRRRHARASTVGDHARAPVPAVLLSNEGGEMLGNRAWTVDGQLITSGQLPCDHPDEPAQVLQAVCLARAARGPRVPQRRGDMADVAR